MIDVRTVAGLVLLALGIGLRAAIAAPLDDAAEQYRPYMIEGIGQALAGARDLRERIAAHDLPGAKKAWISARAGWERSEVFTAGFVPELDAADRRLAQCRQRLSCHRSQAVRRRQHRCV